MESGSAVYRVQERDVQVNQGDLFIIGSHLYHGIQKYVTPSVRAVVLYFHPSLIRSENATIEGAEYLIPFEIQERGFPHGIAASTGVPAQVLDLIRRIHQETVVGAPHAPLAMKTYLKMILVLLMNYYASNVATTGAVIRKNRNLERLQPLFDYVDHHYVENISVEQAGITIADEQVAFHAFLSRSNRAGFRIASEPVPHCQSAASDRHHGSEHRRDYPGGRLLRPKLLRGCFSPVRRNDSERISRPPARCVN